MFFKAKPINVNHIMAISFFINLIMVQYTSIGHIFKYPNWPLCICFNKDPCQLQSFPFNSDVLSSLMFRDVFPFRSHTDVTYLKLKLGNPK